jgi:hypothetical protein
MPAGEVDDMAFRHFVTFYFNKQVPMLQELNGTAMEGYPGAEFEMSPENYRYESAEEQEKIWNTLSDDEKLKMAKEVILDALSTGYLYRVRHSREVSATPNRYISNHAARWGGSRRRRSTKRRSVRRSKRRKMKRRKTKRRKMKRRKMKRRKTKRKY